MRNAVRGVQMAALFVCGLCAGSAVPLLAGAHTWDVNEVFVNADGTIWFVELREAGGGNGEVAVGGHDVISLDTLQSFEICLPTGNCNVSGSTGFKFLLFANQAFADLPGAPQPDQVVAGDVFFDATGDTVRYDPYDNLVFPALPTDGIQSYNEGIGVAVNSPTNFAGDTGSVDASGGGSASGAVVLTMDKTPPPFPTVVLDWSASCEAGDTGVGVYRGTLASLLGGAPPPTYDHAMVLCDVSGSSASLPAGGGDLYFLVVPSAPGSEGSYGRNTAGGGAVERPQGASACKAQNISCP